MSNQTHSSVLLERCYVLSISILLLLVTGVAYRHVGTCGFVTLDDPGYVAEEPMVNQGLRPAGLVWAFTVPHGGNWHPLTSLSHMLDCSLFGSAPGLMHWENLFWHLLNTGLVFLIWRVLTGALWPSALVAALFALHPLHVESVAWISERKDMLSTFFWLLGLGAYIYYTRNPSRARYALILICLVFGLMAKPMVVTFPCTLLLLDYWPLCRWPERSVRWLLMEKIPFFVLACVFGIVTYFVQRSSGATEFGRSYTTADRFGNALVSYVRYLGKTFWPESLAVYYPHPGAWPLEAVFGAFVLLGGVTWFAMSQARRRPWVVFGWFWFLGALVPVIGLVQAGRQALADRYTYVPLLGIFTIIAWSGDEVVARRPKMRAPLITVIVFMLGACFFLTQRQVETWKNGVSLFEHNLVMTKDNATARLFLADALQTAGRPETEVITQCRRALELQPDGADAFVQIASLAAEHRRYDEARSLLNEARRRQPLDANICHHLGIVCVSQGRSSEAMVYFEEALHLQPAHVSSRHELARIFFEEKRFDQARGQLTNAIEADRWDWFAYDKLGLVLLNEGDIEGSRVCFEHALWINPACIEARRYFKQVPSTPPLSR